MITPLPFAALVRLKPVTGVCATAGEMMKEELTLK